MICSTSCLKKLVGLLVIILASAQCPIAIQRGFPLQIPLTRAQASKYPAEFEFITQTIADCYSYLTIKQQRYAFSFAEVTGRFREKISQCTSHEEYINTVREYLKSFHDGHLRLNLSPSAANNAPPKEPAITNTWDLEHKDILVVRVRRLWDQDEVRKSFAETLSLARNAKGILFDLRDNSGGDDSLAFDLFRKLIPKTLEGGKYSIKFLERITETASLLRNALSKRSSTARVFDLQSFSR
jgi:hypothetical protein